MKPTLTLKIKYDKVDRKIFKCIIVSGKMLKENL